MAQHLRTSTSLPPTPTGPAAGAGRDGGFLTTQWSLVLRGRDAHSSDGRAAVAALCERYWYPMYVHVRRRAPTAEDAADLTQGFFAHLLEANVFAAVDPGRGKLRAYLLACCNHYLSNQREKAAALKRGGDRPPLRLDVGAAEARYSREPADRVSPDRLFERRWALTVLDEAMAALERDYDTPDRREVYRLLKPTLVPGDEAPRYAAVAAALGTTEAAVKKAAQRLRERYGHLLREVVAATVGGPDEVDEELRDLFAALAR